MSVLIFGGTGAIGSNVAKMLQKDGEMVVVASRHAAAQPVSQDHVRWISCDIANAEAVGATFKAIHPQKIIHLAAALQFACDDDPILAVRSNILGTANILEAAGAHGVKVVVFGSSVAIYGALTRILKEDASITARTSIYGAAKRFEERLGAECAQKFGFKFVALRYCGVFGTGSLGSRGMAYVRGQIESTAYGQSVTIEGASGEERAQLTYVKDAAIATQLALNHSTHRHAVYNVAGPEENYISLHEYHEIVRQLFPTAGNVTFTGQAVSLSPMDTSRIRRELGFVPKFTVRDGLSDWAAQKNTAAQ